MIEFDVRSSGYDEIRATLRRGANLQDEIGRELGDWAQDHLDGRLYGMENYAPPPAGSTYVRTGGLGAGWGLRRIRQSAVEFFNLYRAVRFVVGDGDGRGQAAIHAGRWWLARKRTEAAIPDLIRRIETRIRRVLR